MLRARTQRPWPITGSNQQPWGDSCQPGGKQTSKCTGFSVTCQATGSREDCGKSTEWHLLWDEAGPPPGAGPPSVEIQTVEPTAAAPRRKQGDDGSSNSFIATTFRDSLSFAAAQRASPEVHCLWEQGALMRQTAGEAQPPPDRWSDLFRGEVHRLSPHPTWGRHEQVPGAAHAAGRYASDVPWHCGESHGDETTCSQASMASGWGPCLTSCGRAGNQTHCCASAGRGHRRLCDSSVKDKKVSYLLSVFPAVRQPRCLTVFQCLPHVWAAGILHLAISEGLGFFSKSRFSFCHCLVMDLFSNSLKLVTEFISVQP